MNGDNQGKLARTRTDIWRKGHCRIEKKDMPNHLTTLLNNEFGLDHDYYLASPKVMVMRIYAVGVTGQAKDVSLPLRM